MDDAQLLRYSRHILLDDIGIEGQERLLAGHALIVGAGVEDAVTLADSGLDFAAFITQYVNTPDEYACSMPTAAVT